MSRQKRDVFDQLLDEVRSSQTATARFDQAVADAMGINRTDMRCLDILDREGPMTAGRLAGATGLTSGAITSVIDRLERAGHVRRIRDTTDRRRVLVEMTPDSQRHAAAFYQGHMAEAERLYHRYTLEQMELLLEFVRGSRMFNERQAERLEKRPRGEP
jgi:DNA-binding MarR family transcriptional regulator